MKGYLKLIVSSVLAGVAISIGCIAYLSTGSAWVFPIGLFIVCSFGLNLFTGNVSFAKHEDLPNLLIILVGNMVGAFIMGVLTRYFKPDLVNDTVVIAYNKIKEGYRLIPLAMLCNALIFVGVALYHQEDLLAVIRLFGLYFATGIFVVCGFEHCIANTFYFALARTNAYYAIPYLIINVLFNAVGGILTYRLIAFIQSEEMPDESEI